jgi:flagellar hook-associated protein 3 FlgL
LQDQNRTLLGIQEQLSTGRRIVHLSDDPLNARIAVATRTTIGKNEQFIRNISATGPQLLETASNIQGMGDVLQRIRELTLQGANGTNSQDDLNAIAAEVDQLLEHVLNVSNHETNGRHIFGGTRTDAKPFVETRNAAGTITSVAYVGNSEFIEIAVSDGVDVTINEPGDRVFQGSVDIHQLLIDIRDNLQSGDQASLQTTRLAEIDLADEQLLSALSRVGAVDNRLDRISNSTLDFNVQLEETLSEAVDADFAEVIVNLNSQSNAYQAALNATARVIQPSLLDFIR